MDILLSILGFTVVLATCLYHRSSLIASVAALTATMVLLSWVGTAGSISWLLYVSAVVILGIPAVRQSLISKKALKLFKQVLPAMSQTEKEALDAGTVWWEAELFKGKPDWNKLHAIKAPSLSQEEQAFLDGPVEEVCAMVNDYQVTHETGRSSTRSMAIPQRQQVLCHDHQEKIWWFGVFCLRSILGPTEANWRFWRSIVNGWCTQLIGAR